MWISKICSRSWKSRRTELVFQFIDAWQSAFQRLGERRGELIFRGSNRFRNIAARVLGDDLIPRLTYAIPCPSFRAPFQIRASWKVFPTEKTKSCGPLHGI